MPRNKKGGKGHKKKKNTRESTLHNRPMIYAEKNQAYAQITQNMGGSRLQVKCSDGKKRSAIIPGRLRKRLWMRKDDIILCELGSMGNDKECHILHKYNNKEIGILQSKGFIDFEIVEKEPTKKVKQVKVPDQPDRKFTLSSSSDSDEKYGSYWEPKKHAIEEEVVESL